MVEAPRGRTMSRTKVSDMSRTPPELVRLTFPDRRALEQEIATNLRHGQAFTREVLEVPPLTEGVIVIVHPLTLREFRLPAEVVMVNGEGEMRGTGLALRAFGRAQLEQLEAFARESGPPPASAPSGDVSQPVRTSPLSAGARSHTATSGVQPAAVQRAAPNDGRPRNPSSAANPALRRPGQEADATAPRPRGAGSARAAQEIDGRGLERGRLDVPQPGAAHARATSAGSTAAVRRPIQEINRADADDKHERTVSHAELARRRTASGASNAAAQRPIQASLPRPVQEINRTELEDKRVAQPQARPRSANTAVSRPRQEADHAAARARATPRPGHPQKAANPIVQPVRQPAQPTAAEARGAMRPANLAASDDVEADDWSDFEHAPEPAMHEQAAEVPTAKQAMPAPVEAPLVATHAVVDDDDDWSDFEHGPEPGAVIPQANVAPAPNAPPEPQPAEEEEGFSIPYDVAAAAKRAPSPAFVSNPHTAVTHRPPPKDDDDDSDPPA